MLKETYKNKIVPKLKKELSLSSVMAVPGPIKVSLNIGMGEALGNPKALDAAEETLMTITGQKPVRTKAKKDVANFKVRKGSAIGLKVDLRGHRMWEFLERLINIALPRVRDFYGLSKKQFDGKGNFSIGLKEQVSFPEVDPTAIDKIRGMQIIIHTSAKTDEEGYALLKALGFPFLD